MTPDERITALAQSVYRVRRNRKNDVTDNELVDFQDDIIEWVNQFIPEIEKEADWSFMRTNDDTSIGTITTADTISYDLPDDIRKLVVNPHRDLTIRQDGSVVATFKLVNPNQASDPNDYDVRDRATQMGRRLIFSRPLTENEVGGTIVADTIAMLPELSHEDVSLLDILDENRDIRQLFVLGIAKNQTLPDIVQGGLTPSFVQKYADLLQKCIMENGLSSEADDVERESFGWIGMVG